MTYTRSQGSFLILIELEIKRTFRKQRLNFTMDDKHNHGLLVDAFQVSHVGDIRPPRFVRNSNFNVAITMLYLTSMKGLFRDPPLDDPNKHLIDFACVCLSYNLPGISQEAIIQRLFSFSLTSKTTTWLGVLPDVSITTWTELTGAFLERFFPPRRRIKLRDETYNFKKVPSKALHEDWLRFKKKVVQYSNHKLSNEVLLDSFYRLLDVVNKSLANNVAKVH